MSTASESTSPNDVAIVGMALRVPGARNVREFWDNLRNGVESIHDVSSGDLIAAGESPERIHDSHYVARTADLPNMEMFDADFFGLSPKDAAVMDPQHRQFLECAWEAMENAARPPRSIDGPVGVFAGCGMGSYFYFNVCSHRQLVDQSGMFLLRHTGNDKDFLSTRASFTFDLHGPSINVQTACSTSLVAVHYAAQSLLNGECDMALAGGVTIELPHRRGYIFQDGEILSPDGHCRAFDHRAAGTVFGSGVGVVVLRRLVDALTDGDHIHAVIKATAVNNDGGNKAGYLAPSVTGQAEAIVEAQGLAGVSADSIQYVECHGTGTYLGDPIEIEALTQAFRRSTNRTGFCRVGSVKTNIGHLDTAAGVVSLIKATLALSHAEIPPSLNFDKPNPAIDFAKSPFVVNDRLTPWPRSAGPRRAAVNSLGVGGTNAHAILEEAPAPVRSTGAAERPELLIFTAKHRKALDQAMLQLGDELERQPALALSDASFTQFAGRKHFDHRRVLAVRDRDEAIALLKTPDPQRTFTHTVVEGATGAVLLFPGGGAQHPGMARALYENDATFRATVDEGLSYLADDARSEIRALWLGEKSRDAEAATELLRPSLQLPAILIVEVALARLWISWGLKPAALIGHSMGENTAACIAGVLSYRDAVGLVHLRGELFDTLSGGGMLSVAMAPQALEARMPAELDLASVNAPELCVVSGCDEAISAFEKALEADGIDSHRVPIDIAAHSRVLDSILGRFEEFLRGVTLQAPSIPIVSNVTGTWLSEREARDPLYWVKHLRSTVRFADGLAVLAEDRARIYIEVGPRKAMASLAKAQGFIDANQVINSLPHPEEATDDRLHFLAAVGRAWSVGLPVEIGRLWDPSEHQRVPLPTYPFQRQRYFLDQVVQSSDASGADQPLLKRPDVESWGYRPNWKQALADMAAGADRTLTTWLVFLDDTGFGERLVARLRIGGHTVTTVAFGDNYNKQGPGNYALCPEDGGIGYDELLRDLSLNGGIPERIVHLWLVTADESFRPGSSFYHRNQERGFDSLFHLAQAMGDQNVSAPTRITIATNGMQRVDEETLFFPEKSTVLGPAQVVPKEFPNITIRVVDLALPIGRELTARERIRASLGFEVSRSRLGDHEIDQSLALFWDDLFAEPGSEIVAYRRNRRWVRSYAPLTLAPPTEGADKFRNEGVYLITGGMGDLALVFAERIAQRYRGRLVLVGRTPLPDRSMWKAYCRTHGKNDRTRNAIEAIERAEAFGGKVLYVTGDVCNREEMSRAVAEARAQFGPINGVLHTAGLIQDDLIQLKSHADIEIVLAPKIQGTAVLDDLFADEPLDFLVLFSSTSTETAPAGQIDYVAANAYLNAYAESRAANGKTQTVAIHWGVWNQVGMAKRAIHEGRAVAREEAAIRPAQQPLFDRWVEDASGEDWLEGDWSPATHWLLNEHRVKSGEAIWPGTGYLEVIAQAMREYSLSGPFEIEDLTILRALHVPDGETDTIRVRLEPTKAGHRFIMKRACKFEDRIGFMRHAEAVVRMSRPSSPVPLNVHPIDARCSLKRTIAAGAPLRSAQDDHLRFGPRWGVLRSVALGSREALAKLELANEFRSDIENGFVLHPAVLDLATGFAMELIDGYDPTAPLWVPIAYGRVLVHRALPASVWSWVRLNTRNQLGEGFATFDVTIADEAGNIVLEVEQLVVKELAQDASFAVRPPSHNELEFDNETPHRRADASPAMAQLAAQVEQGIVPSEGFDALLRVLAVPAPQVIVSSMDLDGLRQRNIPNLTATSTAELFQRPDLESEYVAPRNDIERTVAGFWTELLGVEKIGVHDSFFDVGGHSLIAVRLFRMIRTSYSVDFPISVLFEAPTIAQCADLIAANGRLSGDRAEAETAASPTKPKPVHVVPLHAGEDHYKAPFFICAGMFGNVLNLRHLALQVGHDRPVYALQAKGLYGDQELHETFEDMACDYLAEIREVQPHGPYLLGGFSGGGLTAYAIAQQLLADGDEVAIVVLLDTPLPTQPPLSTRDLISVKLQDFRKQRGAFITIWLMNRIKWEIGRLRRRSVSEEVRSGEQFHNDKIAAAFYRALGRYDLQPYPRPVLIIRPKLEVAYRLSGGRMLHADRNLLAEDNGWTPYIRDLSVVEVPGDHDSMVLEPNVRVLAHRLRTCLDRAEIRTANQRLAAD